MFRRIGIVAKQGDAALRHTLQSVLAVLARHDADVVGTPVIGLDAAALGYREGDEQAVIADRDLIIADKELVASTVGLFVLGEGTGGP